MSLFQVGDKGKTRGGRPYEVIELHNDKSITAIVDGAQNPFFADGRWDIGSDSCNDLLLPDEAEVKGAGFECYFNMKLLHEFGWTDDLLRSAYPNLERKVIPDFYTVPAKHVDHIASYTLKLDENHRVCGLTSTGPTSYTFDLSQNEVTIKDGKLIVTPR